MASHTVPEYTPMPRDIPLTPDARSCPPRRIPERKSSRNLRPSDSTRRNPSSIQLRPESKITVRGHATSPLKRQVSRPVLSRTYIPRIFPIEILDAPRLSHPRLQVGIIIEAPLYIGGATVEGRVQILIDPSTSPVQRQSISRVLIRQISVSVVGIEHCGRKHDMFRALATDLLDAATYVLETSELPFCLDLPIDMGPPPYRTKKAGIRYLLSILVTAQIADKMSFVRQSQEISVLSINDPEKVLTNSPEPLVVSDALKLGRHSLIVKAALHRQIWTSGYPLFADIHIDNPSDRKVRRIELQLERATVLFLHSAPADQKQSLHLIRIPNKITREILARSSVHRCFESLRTTGDSFRTVQFQIPPNLVSVDAGRFFSVRFCFNIRVCASLGKSMVLQIPISIIHPNTVDIPPNSVAQVAQTLDSRVLRPNSPTYLTPIQSFRPGHAFQSARSLSLLELRQDAIGSSDLESLTRALESSPRRFAPNKLTKYASEHTLRPRTSHKVYNRIYQQRNKNVFSTGRSSVASVGTDVRPPQLQAIPRPNLPIHASRNVSFEDTACPKLPALSTTTLLVSAKTDSTCPRSATACQQEAIVRGRSVTAQDRHISRLEDDVKRHLRIVSDSTNQSILDDSLGPSPSLKNYLIRYVRPEAEESDVWHDIDRDHDQRGNSSKL